MKKSTITLGIAAAMSTVLLGSCGLGQKHDESEVRFSHIQAEASYRLVGSGEDYEFADSCDLSYGCKAEFIMPEVLFGRDVRELQDTNQMTKKMVLQEQCKTLPLGDVWEEYCRRCSVAAEGWFADIEKYEEEVLLKRR